MSQTVTGD